MPTLAYNPYGFAVYDPKKAEQPQKKTLNERLDRDFTYHAGSSSQVERFKQINQAARHLAWAIGTYAPDCKEKEEAWKYAQGARMWANAAIACEGSQPEPAPAAKDKLRISNQPGDVTTINCGDFHITSAFPGVLTLEVERTPAK